VFVERVPFISFALFLAALLTRFFDEASRVLFIPTIIFCTQFETASAECSKRLHGLAHHAPYLAVSSYLTPSNLVYLAGYSHKFLVYSQIRQARDVSTSRRPQQGLIASIDTNNTAS
jgi:hypothetical protein